MNNAKQLTLSGDLWAGPLNHEWNNLRPRIEDFDAALAKLDAAERTMITIQNSDESHLAIAGGNGRYVVYACFNDQEFWNLIQDDQAGGIILLNAGGQEGDFPARQVVDFDQASAAGRYFFQFQKMDPSLNWERQ